jgi:hypothetical protein
MPGIDLTDVTYYIGRETIIPSEDIPRMWVWRETLFAFSQQRPSVIRFHHAVRDFEHPDATSFGRVPFFSISRTKNYTQ